MQTYWKLKTSKTQSSMCQIYVQILYCLYLCPYMYASILWSSVMRRLFALRENIEWWLKIKKCHSVPLLGVKEKMSLRKLVLKVDRLHIPTNLLSFQTSSNKANEITVMTMAELNLDQWKFSPSSHQAEDLSDTSQVLERVFFWQSPNHTTSN